MNDESAGGRIFFSSTGRSLVDEDEIVVLSVGVDIGSSTSHLVFSRIVLERLDSRYVVTTRETFYESDILLTPYSAEETIDAQALGAFIERQYKDAKVDPDEIDTGALILTGVAVRRSNARKIGELFARQAGKMVAVSAGDNLETVMAAYGSGAVARSIREGTTVMNVDVGGGTSKISICSEGRVVDLTAIDVGARLICLDTTGNIVRIEEAGRRFAADLGIKLDLGGHLAPEAARALATRMTDRLFEAMAGGSPTAAGAGLLRLDPLAYRGEIDQITFSGGVSEYIYGREAEMFGDLGALLAQEIRARVASSSMNLEPSTEGIRATVIGASQYTTQVSGSTIYVSPMEALPLRNVPVIAPALPLEAEVIDSAVVAIAIKGVLKRLDLGQGDTPVAVFVPWRGSATFQRLHAFCQGAVEGLSEVLAKGHPLVLVGDGDVGGLLGIHLHEEMRVANAIVSVDGLELKEFDYIDIGTMLPTSGAVPVVIKSLIFPTSAAPGKEWQPAPRALGAPAASTPSA
jgi:ethanolamine utilization protein EutA